MLLGTTCPVCCQTTTQEAPNPIGKVGHLPEQVENRVKLFVNWGDQISTPGAKAELKEVKRGEQDGKLFLGYEAYITGLPKDQSYDLFLFPITVDKPVYTPPQISLAADGKMCLTNEKGCLNPVGFSFLPAKGEPFRFLLVSKDGKSKIASMIVPDPIIGADRGCTVEAIRITPKFEIVMVRGKGFKPAEELSYTSDSAGEIIKEKVTVTSDFQLVLFPSVVGKTEGTDTVTAKGSSCNPSVSFKWGSLE
jgi:hypothetical protein